MEKNIENIISNFFRNQCDENQLEHLLNFISIENNYNIFNEYVKINHLSNLSMSQFDKASLLQEIEGRIKESKKRSLIKNYIKKSIIVAAVFMGIIGIATFLNNESLIIESENIVLTKSNGEKIIIDTQKIEVDKLEGLVSPKTNTLTYKKDTISKSFVENTIDVPYGKRFKLKLSDGTIVHLNSGSTFTFPVSFIEGMDRKSLKLNGSELISVLKLEDGISPSDKVDVEIKYTSGEIKKIKALCRIDTKNELEYYKNGGILQYVLRNMI